MRKKLQTSTHISSTASKTKVKTSGQAIKLSKSHINKKRKAVSKANIFFWNIRPRPTLEQLKLLSISIEHYAPDIVCIAEGTSSKEKCKKLLKTFEKLKYSCYYSPLSIKNKSLGLPYKFKPLGLKIFVKDKNIIAEPFSFSDQRANGRIIQIKIKNGKDYDSIIFIHNKAKKGGKEWNDYQRDTLSQLKDMLYVGKAARASKRSLILGDFNLEPWDHILRSKVYMNTFFLNNHYSISKREKKERIYFNPISNDLHNSKITNLGGTFYSNSDGWALFDFVLYDKDESKINYEIIKSIGKIDILNNNATQTKSFLNFDFDHLPILVTLK